MTQTRPGEHLRTALQVPRVRLPAGDEQRGLACDAEVRLLVPDPIGVSPSWSLRGGTRVSSGLIARQSEELEDSFATGPALRLSLLQDTSECPPFVQSRRRPEKWTTTGKWDSRGSVTVDIACVCTLFGLHFSHKRTVAGDAAAAGGARGAPRAGGKPCQC